jgi:uncharacterized protein YdbL (DUF1318 family)
MKRMLLGLAGLMSLAVPASAQSGDLLAALRSGQVGERFDGYLGFASPTSASVQRQVSAINIQRRSLYTSLASRRRVLPSDVGIATGCELLGRIGVGQSYMLQDAVWRRRTAGQSAPRPAYCQ